jgi:hypothetical protein
MRDRVKLAVMATLLVKKATALATTNAQKLEMV